ncbi:hypothetical protein GGQ85_000865 [Nitrobacter vulgaris]|nr:hypothetical protein [Nitrobacter vulgaris]
MTVGSMDFVWSRWTVISQVLPPGCGGKARKFMGLAKRKRRAAFSELAIGSSRLKISFRKKTELKPVAAPSPISPHSKILKPPSAAVPVLNKAISQIENEDGWGLLGPMGQQRSKLASDFDVRTYGFGKLSSLIREIDAFEIDETNGPMRIRRAKRWKPTPLGRQVQN